MTKKSDAEKAEAIATLRKFGVKPGATIYTIVKHCSRSGMQRSIACYVVTRNKQYDKTKYEPTDISGLVARAIGARRDDKNGGVKQGGCGMDMGFHVVYCLGRAMFPNGGPRDKSNTIRQAQEKRAGRDKENDGGYLLRQRWM